ncbi:MAG: hypothetical protein ACK56V_07770 [Bacteroidota bacterium]
MIRRLDTLSSVEIVRAAASGFESGFSGCIVLTITSLVGMGGLLLNGAFISWLFADALRIGEKKVKK